MRSFDYSVVAVLAGGLTASAHSFVSNINIGGAAYDGWRPTNPGNTASAIGWSTTAFDQGYVNQSGYQTEEIICHRGAKNALVHAIVEAGDTVHLQWNGWPENHKGPVMDYLASCGESCETVDKRALEFFKINELGLLDGSKPPGWWASDELIANNNSWMVRIPERIQPGFYVLRTEIIALHNASNETGAQNYPQCVNIEITGNGTDLPAGVPAQALYNPNDESMHLDIYKGVFSYRIPGPPVISGAHTATLSHPVPTTTGTPIDVDDSPTSAQIMPITTTTAASIARRQQERDMEQFRHLLSPLG